MLYPVLSFQAVHGRTLSMPYTIVFFCGICDMPYLSYSSTGAVVDTRMPGIGDGKPFSGKPASQARGVQSQHKSQVAYGKPCAPHIYAYPPQACTSRSHKSVFLPCDRCLILRRALYIFLGLLARNKRGWESCPRLKTGQHLLRCTTGESTCQPLLHPLARV